MHANNTSCMCALQLSSAYGKLGNIDANTGDAQIGWDTDQFLTDPKQAMLVAEVILKQGGLAPGARIPYCSFAACSTARLSQKMYCCTSPSCSLPACIKVLPGEACIEPAIVRGVSDALYRSGPDHVIAVCMAQAASTLMPSCGARART